MSDGASLRAVATASPRSAVVFISGEDVQVVGGTILGERAQHRGRDGEWGMGIEVRSASVALIDGVKVRDCWGDGIYIGALPTGVDRESRNVTLRNCHMENNRRQGLSITGAIDVQVEACSFVGTHGTAPQCGIDLEPNGALRVREVRILRCQATGNAGSGIALSGPNSNSVENVTLTGNTCSGNRQHGIELSQVRSVSVTGNFIEDNGQNGIDTYRDIRDVEIRSNRIGRNSASAPLRYDNIVLRRRSSNNVIAENEFTGSTAGSGSPRYDIRIATSDCVGNQLLRNHLRKLDPWSPVLDNGSLTRIVSR